VSRSINNVSDFPLIQSHASILKRQGLEQLDVNEGTHSLFSLDQLLDKQAHGSWYHLVPMVRGSKSLLLQVLHAI
jgi:hypothetical protein